MMVSFRSRSNVRRRDFICAAAPAAMLSAQTAARGRVESIEMISRQPEYYHGWPTLAARRNGELLLAYSGGRDAHVCPFGRVELMRSRDGGRRWSWPEVVLDSPIDDRDCGVLETPSGSLLVTTFTSLAYEAVLKDASGWPPEKLARWQAVDLRTTPEQRRGLLDTWMLRSTDDGMTWSAPYRVPVNSPHGPTALADGRLLYAGKQLWRPGTKVGVCESSDDGKSWQWLVRHSRSSQRRRGAVSRVARHRGGRWPDHLAHSQPQSTEPRRDLASGIDRWRTDLDDTAPDRRLGSTVASVAAARRPIAHDLRISPRAIRQPGANQCRPRHRRGRSQS